MFLISLSNSRMKRLNLYFTHEEESQEVMDLIMEAKGFSCALAQY